MHLFETSGVLILVCMFKRKSSIFGGLVKVNYNSLCSFNFHEEKNAHLHCWHVSAVQRFPHELAIFFLLRLFHVFEKFACAIGPPLAAFVLLYSDFISC